MEADFIIIISVPNERISERPRGTSTSLRECKRPEPNRSKRINKLLDRKQRHHAVQGRARA